MYNETVQTAEINVKGLCNRDHPTAVLVYTSIWKDKRAPKLNKLSDAQRKYSSPHQNKCHLSNQLWLDMKKLCNHCLMNYEYLRSLVAVRECLCCEDESQSAPVHLLTGKHPLARLCSRLSLLW